MKIRERRAKPSYSPTSRTTNIDHTAKAMLKEMNILLPDDRFSLSNKRQIEMNRKIGIRYNP